MERHEYQDTERRRTSSFETKMRGMAVLIVILTMATVILFALTMTFAFRPAEMSNRDAMENLYQRNFYDLTDTMSDVEVELDKMMVANGKTLQRELSDAIWRNTGAAVVYLDGLPVDHHSIESTYRLVNQLGDYVYVLSAQLAERDMTEAERANVEGLYLRTAAVNNALSELRANMGSYRFVDHLDYDRIAAGEDYVGGALGEANGGQMPELIYNGPFSDALANVDYSGLNALEEVSEEQSLARAKELFGDAEFTGVTEGDPLCRQYKTSAGYLLMTVRGGYPFVYDAEATSGQAELQREDAIEAARKWAEDAFGQAFECVWFGAEGGSALVNLATEDKDVAYYSELVKVKIDLNSGAVIGAEARAYLANRPKHRFYEASVSAAQAKAAVNAKLEPVLVRMAVIPRKSGETTLVYEFRGTLNGKTYLSYVDAHKGEEVALMRVVETDGGVLIQ